MPPCNAQIHMDMLNETWQEEEFYRRDISYEKSLMRTGNKTINRKLNRGKKRKEEMKNRKQRQGEMKRN